jgi:RimJ/RimL family protein N-acetyltransferase
MEIRQARPGDEVELIKLFRTLYQESDYFLIEADEFSLSAKQQAQLIEKHTGSRSWALFVVEINNSLVGFLGGTGGNFKRNRHSIHLAMGVLERYQGKGIGRQLLQRFLDWASINQYHRIELSVMEGNNRAISLYQSMGFDIEGSKHDSLKVRGEYVNEYSMARILKA